MTAAFYYVAAVHLSNLNAESPLGTVTIRRGGSTDIVITIASLSANDLDGVASKYFWHMFNSGAFSVVGNDRHATSRYRNYSTSSLGLALQTAVRAQQTSLGWPSASFTAQWHEETAGGAPLPHYRFTNTQAITYQFSTLAGAWLFGTSSILLSGSLTTHTLSTPSHCWFPYPTAALAMASTPDGELSGLDYNPEGIASLAISDSGRGYGNARLTNPIYRKWVQEHVRKQDVYRQNAPDFVWAWQDMLEYCGTMFPFYVAHGGFANSFSDYEVFQFTAEGARLRARPASAANHAQIHCPFDCLSAGHLVFPS